jgi:hypothetical protein
MFGWSRVHFQKRKCALFQLKNSNKIAEKIRHCLQGTGILPNKGMHVFQMSRK